MLVCDDKVEVKLSINEGTLCRTEAHVMPFRHRDMWCPRARRDALKVNFRFKKTKKKKEKNEALMIQGEIQQNVNESWRSENCLPDLLFLNWLQNKRMTYLNQQGERVGGDNVGTTQAIFLLSLISAYCALSVRRTLVIPSAPHLSRFPTILSRVFPPPFFFTSLFHCFTVTNTDKI